VLLACCFRHSLCCGGSRPSRQRTAPATQQQLTRPSPSTLTPPQQHAGGATAARALRQVTDSLVGMRVNKSNLIVAATQNAESVSDEEATGIAVSESSLAAVASQTFPSSMSRVSTPNLYHHDGVRELPAATFRTVAVSTTTGGAAAVAAPESMALAAKAGTPGTARGSTMRTFDPDPPPRGLGRQGLVQTASVGLTDRPSGAFTISAMGDGPHAIAQAGEAVASAYSSKDSELRADHSKGFRRSLLGGRRQRRRWL